MIWIKSAVNIKQPKQKEWTTIIKIDCYLEKEDERNTLIDEIEVNIACKSFNNVSRSSEEEKEERKRDTWDKKIKLKVSEIQENFNQWISKEKQKFR